MEVEREDSWQVAEILILSSATLNPIEKSQGFHRDSDELSQWDGGWIQGVDPGGWGLNPGGGREEDSLNTNRAAAAINQTKAQRELIRIRGWSRVGRGGRVGSVTRIGQEDPWVSAWGAIDGRGSVGTVASPL